MRRWEREQSLHENDHSAPHEIPTLHRFSPLIPWSAGHVAASPSLLVANLNGTMTPLLRWEVPTLVTNIASNGLRTNSLTTVEGPKKRFGDRLCQHETIPFALHWRSVLLCCSKSVCLSPSKGLLIHCQNHRAKLIIGRNLACSSLAQLLSQVTKFYEIRCRLRSWARVLDKNTHLGSIPDPTDDGCRSIS